MRTKKKAVVTALWIMTAAIVLAAAGMVFDGYIPSAYRGYPQMLGMCLLSAGLVGLLMALPLYRQAVKDAESALYGQAAAAVRQLGAIEYPAIAEPLDLAMACLVEVVENRKKSVDPFYKPVTAARDKMKEYYDGLSGQESKPNVFAAWYKARLTEYIRQIETIADQCLAFGDYDMVPLKDAMAALGTKGANVQVVRRKVYDPLIELQDYFIKQTMYLKMYRKTNDADLLAYCTTALLELIGKIYERQDKDGVGSIYQREYERLAAGLEEYRCRINGEHYVASNPKRYWAVMNPKTPAAKH